MNNKKSFYVGDRFIYENTVYVAVSFPNKCMVYGRSVPSDGKPFICNVQIDEVEIL